MTGSDVVTLSPEGRADRRLTKLEAREEMLEAKIDKIEKNIRTAYDNKIDGFLENPLTGDVHYIGTDKFVEYAFERLAELKEELKV